MKEDEQSWLEQAKAGNCAGFEKLAKAYEDSIYNFALKMCGHVEDAKDILQETLFAAFQSLREFQGRSKLSTWLFKVAMSACQKMRRKGKFQPDYHLSLDQLLPHLEERSLGQEFDRGPEEVASEKEKRRVLEQAIRTIPLRYRLVLVLRDLQGFSTEEASDILRLSVPVVKVRLHRGRLFLRRKMQEYSREGIAKRPRKKQPIGSDCKEILRLSSDYLDGDADEGLCARIKAHLGACDTCASLCQALKETTAMCMRSKQERVPTAVRREIHASVKRSLTHSTPLRRPSFL
jgi:RNA polymerase sigma-70 factor (ECF subfamily)